MDRFLIKEFSERFIEEELSSVGFDDSYLKVVQNKYRCKIYKIYSLSPIQATILKQIALSCGTDCAVHREVLTHKVETSDALLFATNAQLKQIIKKLYVQPFGMKQLAEDLENQSNQNLTELQIRNTKFDWKKTYIMGILNCTPDSFSDGGEFLQKEDAIKHFKDMVEFGADIIDIGAESTAPDAKAVNVSEEIKRIENILSACRSIDKDIPISIDTRNADTAQKALELGADIVNDVSGFCYDKNMAQVVKNAGAYCVLTFDDVIGEENTLDAVIKGLLKRVENAVNTGISKEKIIIDTGLGFNKTFEQNIELIKHADEICSLGFPVLYGLSRKSFVQKMTNLAPKETEFANVSLATYLGVKGVNIIRVHDIKAHKTAFCTLDRVIYD